MINIFLYVVTGLLIPFIGTVIGSAFVFFMKRTPGARLMIVLDSFAAGVMCAASFFSLIRPACERAEETGFVQLLSCSLGFFSGMIVFTAAGKLLNRFISAENDPSGQFLMLAVAIHNIPEGMAVGIVYAGLMASGNEAHISGALSLSIGIALQNIPEGAIISMPLKSKGKGTLRAFSNGVASGIAELIPGILTLFLSAFVNSILPFSLCFAAGAMFFVVLKELSIGFSDAKNGRLALSVFSCGFTLMMLLDTFFG